MKIAVLHKVDPNWKKRQEEAAAAKKPWIEVESEDITAMDGREDEFPVEVKRSAVPLATLGDVLPAIEVKK